jgi:hypothetical protein
MTDIFNGRFTAASDKPLVVFLIGMRINRWRAVAKWWPVAQAMPAMLRELKRRPDSGFLWFHTFTSGRTTCVLQYWRSFDDLLAYAHDKAGVHFPAWGNFNRAVGNSGVVGIWHETYLVEPGKFECIYSNMPLFGLAAAARHVPATGRLASARDRMTVAPAA